ncbi:MAG: glycosyltransferase family 2 protein [Zetaproteobacteria bacterium]|nr:MAG: glycosyltransferase family 2 protein [Zetaproteobacteria bacterium]
MTSHPSSETPPELTIVIPVFNEAGAIGQVVRKVRTLHPEAELLVIDDGSDDASGTIAEQAGATRVIRHPYNKGNGAAIKRGIHEARGAIVVLMDGDGQHDPADIARMIEHFPEYDMVVGARGREGQAGWHRALANRIYNGLASYMTDFPIEDLTSGFRAFKREMILPYLHLFPNGFSYPTTSTMAMLKAGANLKYIPIRTAPRIGNSKIRLLHDGSRFFLILMKLVTLFSPMRIFLPVSALFGSMGATYSIYTLSHGRFTNMAALLLIVAVLVFLMGLIAEQLAAIHTQGRR